MARRALHVTWTALDPDVLPEFTSEGVALALLLAENGVLKQIAQKVQIRRQCGYTGLDVVAVLLFYFASEFREGLHAFRDRIAPWHTRLAALVARSGLASRSTLSRALQDAEFERVRPATEWLLSEGAGIDVVLCHPAAMSLDALGRPWHVFDFDPTVTVVRQRALPRGPDDPEPWRRSEELAAGHGGTKRGEVQLSRATLQHAGSSAWLFQEVGPGNGTIHDVFTHALSVVVRTCQRLGHPLSRALLRTDGAFGWVPYYTLAQEQGVPFLSRLTRPELFTQAPFREVLRTGAWFFVPDSGSGPRRSALEVGLVTLPAADETKRSDGTAYEPIEMRVVVCRYPRTTQARAKGVRIGDWQYELFATTLPADAWPAPEVVASYFGRSGQENRLAQEDREAGLDHLFSYHLPGQELATSVGLWVWNLRLVQGFTLSPPPVAREPACPRAVVRDERPVQGLEELAGPRTPSEGASESAALVEGAARGSAAAALHQALGALDWPALLATRPGWSWAIERGLHCPEGRPLELVTIESRNGRSVRLIFLRPGSGCTACSHRTRCLSSPSETAAKQLKLTVPLELGKRLDPLLAAVHRERVRARRRATKSASKPNRPRPPARPPFALRPSGSAVSPWSVEGPLLRPATARQQWRARGRTLRAKVRLYVPSPRRRHALLCRDAADRQHRRQTWTQQLARYALDPQAEVWLELACPPEVRNLLTTSLSGPEA